jgi:hypothetical protein
VRGDLECSLGSRRGLVSAFRDESRVAACVCEQLGHGTGEGSQIHGCGVWLLFGQIVSGPGTRDTRRGSIGVVCVVDWSTAPARSVGGGALPCRVSS